MLGNRCDRDCVTTSAWISALIAIVATVAGAPAWAEIVPRAVDGAAVPASPELGKVPVSAQFRFPDDFAAIDESTAIICQALVRTNGSVSARKCAQHGGSDRLRAWLRNEIHHRMKRARFRPATIDGQAVAVSMPFRVVVSCDGDGDCGVAVYPNAGQYAAALGNAYYAPQEVTTEVGTWYDRVAASDACSGARAEVCTGQAGFSFGAAVKVGEDGLVTGVGLLAQAEPGDFPVEAAFTHLVEARFIPAQLEGEPRELLIHTPTIHSPRNKHFPRNQCREVSEIGTRLGRDCYTMQEMAALRPADESGFAENLEFWLEDFGASAGL